MKIFNKGVTTQPLIAYEKPINGSYTYTFSGNVVVTEPNIPEPKEQSDGESDPYGLEYVDLGLPSGTLWAKMNIGATNENEVGTIFEYNDFFKINEETGNNEYINTQYPSELFPDYDQYTELQHNTTLEVLDDSHIKLTSKNNGNSLILTLDKNGLVGRTLEEENLSYVILFDKSYLGEVNYLGLDSIDLPFPLRTVKVNSN